MADRDLTLVEADALIAMPKCRTDDDIVYYPAPGCSLVLPLTSTDKKENFLLDITRGKINLLKANYQNRARQTTILVRVDLGGAPHRNPDGKEVPCPHIHLYREGYGDKWASPLPTDGFEIMGDLKQTLDDFMRYCNIIEPPIIQKGIGEWTK